MRVYELSKLVGFTNKELLKILNDMGLNIKSHIAVVPPEMIEKVEKEIEKLKKKESVEVVETKQPVIVASNKISNNKIPKEKIINHKIDSEKIEKKEFKPILELKPTVAGDLAIKLNKPIGEIILALLKQGIIANKNQILDISTVKKLADFYTVPVVEYVEQRKTDEFKPLKKQIEEPGNFVTRMPIIVVIGHVDHGKTTLLDFIRKTRVAIKEKGGITQHLGAYEVDLDQGSMVFLDTPGHEAFSMLRSRGVNIADIAVLVVAADDGVMPQTVEAIRLAREANLPIIIALNKIDKATALQIEQTKQQLAKNDLVAEEWGGSTVMIPISAKTGQGIDNLLDIIILQSQLLELKANTSVAAKGYILESKFEKGRGPVATVILQHGELKIGENFLAGDVAGKVNSLIDSFGIQKKEIGPSVPVRVAGFNELPKPGDIFQVVSAVDYKKQAKVKRTEALGDIMQKTGEGENVLNIIIKTDNISSREAILNLIEKLSKKLPVQISIVYSAIGDISEYDVNLASDTKSMIYALHVKIQPNAYESISRHKVPIKTFDIIYKLIEDLEAASEAAKPVEYVDKKIGEGAVIQVFDIKNLGVIAGVRVKSGKFVKDGKIKVYRRKNKILESAVDSLQREKKSVKEVHTGFECAILVRDFQDWQIDDLVEYYQSVPVGK